MSMRTASPLAPDAMRTGAGVVALILCVGVLQGCTMKKPVAPSTDFTVSLPVADQTVTLEDLATDSTRSESAYLNVGEDRVVTLDFSASFDRREEVGDRLRVRPTARSFSTPIGDIALPGEQLPEITVGMSVLLGRDVSSGIVPLLPAAVIDHRVGMPLKNVQSVVIKEGGLDLELDNALPVPIHDLQMSLVDQGNGGSVVAVLDLGTVSPGASASGTFDLGGKEISGDLLVGVRGATPEATGVEVARESGVTVRGALKPLIVTRATAVIPAQEFAASQVLRFPDDRILVQRATIRRGGLTLRVRNDIPVLMEVEFSLDELHRADGSVNSFLVDRLRPNETREVHFDLQDNEFAPENPRELKLSYRVRTVASDTPVTLEAGGQIRVEAVTEDLVFGRVEGVLNRVELTLQPVTKEVDFPRGLDNLALSSARMLVYLRSAVGLRSRIDLDLRGSNQDGRTAELQVGAVFERGSPTDPVNIVVEPPTEALTDFLNLLPTRVEVRPTVLLGDGQGTELIEPSNWVQLDSVRFIAPGRFSILSATTIKADPVYRDLQDEEARRRIESNLNRAEVLTRIENHLPIGVRVGLRVTSWRKIVGDMIRSQRPDLSTDDALLAWLMTEDAWRYLASGERAEVRDRLEEAMGLDPGALRDADSAAILDRIQQRGAAEDRTLFINLILSSLDNDVADGGKRQVEALLGTDISHAEWEEFIAASVYANPELSIPPAGGPFAVAAAPVDADGRVTESKVSSRRIELTRDQVLIFLRKGGVYTGVLTELDPTGGNVVLLAEHYVNVQAATKIHMELNRDLIGN